MLHLNLITKAQKRILTDAEAINALRLDALADAELTQVASVGESTLTLDDAALFSTGPVLLGDTVLTCIGKAGNVLTLSAALTEEHLQGSSVSQHPDYAQASMLISVAEAQIKAFTRRALLTETYEAIFKSFRDDWLHDHKTRLPRPPLIRVDSVSYLDNDLTRVDMTPDQYKTSSDSQLGSIHFLVKPAGAAHVTVRFKAGYGENPSDLPDTFRYAAELILPALYNSECKDCASELTQVNSLLYPYRVIL